VYARANSGKNTPFATEGIGITVVPRSAGSPGTTAFGMCVSAVVFALDPAVRVGQRGRGWLVSGLVSTRLPLIFHESMTLLFGAQSLHGLVYGARQRVGRLAQTSEDQGGKERGRHQVDKARLRNIFD
jgi:hypothetical protein